MRYDPFVRGPHPVGVVTVHGKDARRERELPLEVWYPASDAHRGQDLDPATRDGYRPIPAAPPVPQAAVRGAAPRPGPHPLAAFSHGFGGHRCQSTFLCTHLASHGYVVVAPDHVGNTIGDLMQEMLRMFSSGGGAAPDPLAMLARVGEMADLRPDDVSHALDQALGAAAPVEADPERVAVVGHSFGGWTTLMAAGLDPRVRAAVPLAPAGGETDLPVNPFEERLSLAWERAVPTLFVVAERDSLLPLRGMHGLLARTPEPRRMVILEDTDHQHFCDNAEQIHELFRAMRIPGPWSELDLPSRMAPFSELVPAAEAEEAVRGLVLAHLDAHLCGRDEAHALLSDAARSLAERGLRGKLV